MAGIEPATDGLRNRCSTAELHWRHDYPVTLPGQLSSAAHRSAAAARASRTLPVGT